MDNPRRPVDPDARHVPSEPTPRTGASGDAAVERRAAERLLTEGEETFSLHEEQIIPHKEMRYVGDVEIRTVVEEIPGRVEVDLAREEVEVQHVAVNEYASERKPPWEENGALTIPIYEEQLVVVKRLVLREYLKVRRVATTERQLFEELLRRERLVIDDVAKSGLVHEQYPTDADHAPGAGPVAHVAAEPADDADAKPEREASFLERLGRRVLE